jgi:hypothetical protein
MLRTLVASDLIDNNEFSALLGQCNLWFKKGLGYVYDQQSIVATNSGKK